MAILSSASIFKFKGEVMNIRLSQEALQELKERYTYEGVDLLGVVIHQAQGANIDKNNDLCAIKNFNEALDELYTAYQFGRDTGINGFMWHAQSREMFEKNEKAILKWFDKYQAENSDFESKGELLAAMANHKFDVCDDLLCGGLLTKALIARQLMYEIACDLCENYKIAS